jgi:hypothetical protein
MGWILPKRNALRIVEFHPAQPSPFSSMEITSSAKAA